MREERLRRALLSLFFVSLCLPVAIQQTALGLLLAFLAYAGWRNQGLPATPLDRPLLLFFAALLLSTLFSPDVLNSLLGYRRLWLVGAFFCHLSPGAETARGLAAGVSDGDGRYWGGRLWDRAAFHWPRSGQAARGQ